MTRAEKTLPRRALRKRRRWGLYAIIAVPILIVLSLISLIPALSAARAMEEGKSALADAQRMFESGQLGKAQAEFDRARNEFDRASGHAGNVLIHLESLVPYLGRTADTIRGLSDIGVNVSQAGVDLSSGISALPSGFDSLAPAKGRIQVGALEQLAPSVTSARAALERAHKTATGLPKSWVFPLVEDATALVRERLDSALPAIRSADALLGSLPEFAGQTRPRRYFVAAQNPAELRGTGGLIGLYSILTIDKGKMSLRDFESIQELPNRPDSEPPESMRIPTQFGRDVSGEWSETNEMPQGPIAATMIEALWERTMGQKLDGTIFIDPQALTYMIEAAGAVPSQELGVTLTPGNVVAFVTNRAYFVFDDSDERKEALGIAARDVWTSFLREAPPEKALRALVTAAGAGHIFVHARDPRLEAAFLTAGAAGEFGTDGGDFLGSVVNNFAGNKVDFYMKRSIRYEVTLLADGQAKAQTEMTFTNDAPANAKPGYAMGPFLGISHRSLHLGPGDNHSLVSLYTPKGTLLTEITEDGKHTIVQPELDPNFQLYGNYIRIDAQREKTLGYSLDLPRVWTGDNAIGSYNLKIQAQASTVKPTTAEVVVHAPSGMHFTEQPEGSPIEVDGTTATWSGEVGTGVELDLTFERGFWGRAWARVGDFVSKPVVRL
ncbi:MAG: DUF4012 domain-containing protein [Actinomycetota bacterium]